MVLDVVDRVIDRVDDVECFLCAPEHSLVAFEGVYMRVIAGLGPIVPNYFMIASKDHSRSLADVYAEVPDAITELRYIRETVSSILGPLLMTEHGRVPLCRDDGDQHEQHCHHAHALFFPMSTRIDAEAASYYQRDTQFGTLEAALRYAAAFQSYLLVSNSGSDLHIFTGPLNVPRQLARTLVALQTGRADRADWRLSPAMNEAQENAMALRAILGESNGGL